MEFHVSDAAEICLGGAMEGDVFSVNPDGEVWVDSEAVSLLASQVSCSYRSSNNVSGLRFDYIVNFII